MQTSFIVEDAEKRDDCILEYLAAIVESLNVYAVLRKVDQKDPQEYFNDVIAPRTAETLEQLVKEPSKAARKN